MNGYDTMHPVYYQVMAGIDIDCLNVSIDDINRIDITGNSALSMAIRYGNNNALRTLLEYGANIRDADINQATFLGNTDALNIINEYLANTQYLEEPLSTEYINSCNV